MEFNHIDTFDNGIANNISKGAARTRKSAFPESSEVYDMSQQEHRDEPKRLENGRWTCNHRCKSKQRHVHPPSKKIVAKLRNRCKHLCCREGLDKPPKPSVKSNSTKTNTTKSNQSREPIKQVIASNRGQLPMTFSGGPRGQGRGVKPSTIDRVDLTTEREVRTTLGQQNPKGLNSLHSSVPETAPVKVKPQKRPSFSYARESSPSLSFLDEAVQGVGKFSSDYDDSWMDDFPSPSALLQNTTLAASQLPFPLSGSNHGTAYDESVSELEACLVGLDDSMTLDNDKITRAPSAPPHLFQTNDNGEFGLENVTSS